jgi:hypothetical protein
MHFTSLPDYQTAERPSPARPDKTEGVSLRGAYLVRDLIVLAAFVVLLCWLRRTATEIEQPPAPAPPARPPLDFKLVEERFDKVRRLAAREQVEELLGARPPINGDWGADLQAWEELAEHSNRHFGIPGNRFWALWTDPKDGNRGVAILFAADKVYYVAKKGF